VKLKFFYHTRPNELLLPGMARLLQYRKNLAAGIGNAVW